MIGTAVERVDAVEKVTGAAVYVADLRFAGCCTPRCVRPAPQRADAVGRHQRAPSGMPGVKAVVTGEDTAQRKWGAFRPDLYPLAIGRVRYVGDEVAAVAAIDPATRAARPDKIVVQYEVLPAVLSLDAGARRGAPLVHDDAPGNVAHQFNFERGDVDDGFERSDVIVEGTWESARQWHALARDDRLRRAAGRGGRVTMWCNTQTPFLARRATRPRSACREAQVRVIQTEVGGGFGGKSGDDNASVICAILAPADRARR